MVHACFMHTRLHDFDWPRVRVRLAAASLVIVVDRTPSHARDRVAHAFQQAVAAVSHPTSIQFYIREVRTRCGAVALS